MGAANVALSQTPLLKNASLLELESILAEYGDVETERVQLDLEQGTVVILEISYSALPQTVLTAYASEGPIMLFGYFSEQDIDPRRFLLSDEARGQNSWIFEVELKVSIWALLRWNKTEPWMTRIGGPSACAGVRARGHILYALLRWILTTASDEWR